MTKTEADSVPSMAGLVAIVTGEAPKAGTASSGRRHKLKSTQPQFLKAGDTDMALLPYLKKEQLPPGDQDVILDHMHIYELLAHNPDTARAMIGLGTHIRAGKTLGEKLKELLILQVGFVTKCEYEYSHHLKIAEKVGLSEKDIKAVALETAGQTTHLDERTRVALRAARQITTEVRCGNDVNQLLLQHFQPAELVDLIVTVGFYNLIVRFLETLNIDVEDQYLAYLKKYPLQT